MDDCIDLVVDQQSSHKRLIANVALTKYNVVWHGLADTGTEIVDDYNFFACVADASSGGTRIVCPASSL